MHRCFPIVLLATGSLAACKVDSGSTVITNPPWEAGLDSTSDVSGPPQEAQVESSPEAVSDPDTSSASDALEDKGGTDAPDVLFAYDSEPPKKDACVSTVVGAKLPTLAVYILLDRSGSMTFANKWDTAVQGISQFLQAPGAAGMKVALQYFPLNLDAGESCDGTAYALPAVAMGLLPAQGAAVLASLGVQTPEGSTTPTEGALRGIAQYGQSYASTPPGNAEKVIGLLVTDGMPAGPCDNSTAALQAIASGSFKAVPSVPIYVMGMSGADFTVLSKIAEAGGTVGAYSVTSGGPDAVLATLKEIQGKALGCEFSMPVVDAGVIDPKQVEVLYTPGGGTAQKLSHQAGAGTCGLGWYYDDSNAPTKILLCPSTCKVVQEDPSGAVQISLGCLGS